MTTTTIENGIEVYNYCGKKYRSATKNDVGKLIYPTDSDFEVAMVKAPRKLLSYNETKPDYPFQSSAGFYWKFAFLELEPAEEFTERVLGDDEIIREGDMYRESHTPGLYRAIQSVGTPVSHAKGRWGFDWQWVRKEPVQTKPNWLPEGARILRDDEIIRKGDMFCAHRSGHHIEAKGSVGLTPATARDSSEAELFTWYRPASSQVDELKAAVLDFIKAENEKQQAVRKAARAAHTLDGLLKGPDQFFVQDGNDCYLFTVDRDNRFACDRVREV
jgi:hypothetical protein